MSAACSVLSGVAGGHVGSLERHLGSSGGTRWTPIGAISFWCVFSGLCRRCGEHCSIIVVLLENHIFLKIVVLPKQSITFWRCPAVANMNNNRSQKVETTTIIKSKVKNTDNQKSMRIGSQIGP